MIRTVAAVSLAFLLGCTAADRRVNAIGETNPASRSASRAASGPSIADCANYYKNLQLITPAPACVDLRLYYLCRGVTQSELDAMKERSPHALAFVNVYMNKSAEEAFWQKEKYPVGSVIVKEKVSNFDFRADAVDGDAKGNKKSVASRPAVEWAGVGGMIKRDPGYNSEHGDWEYFYFDDPKKVESGKFDNCIKCHDGAKDRDYVYGTWAKEGK